eukprot:TRINITY_DN14038_c0_g1_i1.p1 TRINITY_DN14038_c0_g1~~TRINITY_DN14038_c0_g1_i1.p1  ORF type:complete len:902 (+),score=215.43 TRINITY_DN14038_c0_g1_i1:105-2810(+)
MAELPDELLNQTNKQLKLRVDAADQKLLLLKDEFSSEKYLLETQKSKLTAIKKQMQSAAQMLETHKGVWEAEENQVQSIGREVSKLAAEVKKQLADETSLKLQATEKEAELSKKNAILDEFSQQTKITKVMLSDIINSQQTSEAKATAMAQMSESDAKKYENLLCQRDDLVQQTEEQKAKLQEESEVAKSLISQSEKVHTDIQKTLVERMQVIEQLNDISNLGSSADQRLLNLKESIQEARRQLSQGRLKKKDLSEVLLVAKSQAGQLEHIASEKGRTKETLLVKVDSLFGAEYTTERELQSLQSAIHTAQQELRATATEMSFLRDQLRERLQTTLGKESENATLRDHLRDILRYTESQYQMEKELQALKERFASKMRQLSSDWTNITRKTTEATAMSTAAIETKTKLERELQSLRFSDLKSVKQLSKAEASSAEYQSVIQSLEAVKQIKKQRLREAENQTSQRNEEMIAEATNLRKQLEGQTRYGAALKSSVTSVGALCNREQTLLEDLIGSELTLKGEVTEVKSEISGLKTELAKGSERLLLTTKMQEALEATTKSCQQNARQAAMQLQTEEQRREELDYEMQSRLTEIDAHQAELKFCLRKHEEEKRTLQLELQDKTSQHDQLRNRYVSHMKSLYYSVIATEEETSADGDAQNTEGRDAEIERQIEDLEPSEIQARFITTIASVRMKLQERGDKLDQLLVKSSKEDMQISRALSLIGNSNMLKKRENNSVAWKEITGPEKLAIKHHGQPDDEIHSLRLSCGRLQHQIDEAASILNQHKTDLQTVRKEASQKQSDLERLTKKLTSRKRQLAILQKSPSQLQQQLHSWAVKRGRNNPELYKKYRQLLDNKKMAPTLSGGVGKSLSVSGMRSTRSSSLHSRNRANNNNQSVPMISGIGLGR